MCATMAPMPDDQPDPASLPGKPDKPFSPSCERNRGPILEVLRRHFATRQRVLEIGSGTGQHAVHFARHLPHLLWQCTDQAEHLPGMQLWLNEANLPNIAQPQVLDVSAHSWPDLGAAVHGGFDAVFTANTLHYMPWASVQALFAALPAVLAPGAMLIAYGPFNVDGQFTSPSNAQFDVWLKQRHPLLGVRDLAEVDALAAAQGLQLLEDCAMPANNRCLIWQAGA
jgi:cyclopropane fatty-acyl-phospholipid synthase-like methyltransferase